MKKCPKCGLTFACLECSKEQDKLIEEIKEKQYGKDIGE